MSSIGPRIRVLAAPKRTIRPSPKSADRFMLGSTSLYEVPMVWPPAIVHTPAAFFFTVGPVEFCSVRMYWTPTLPRRRIVSVRSVSMFALV